MGGSRCLTLVFSEAFEAFLLLYCSMYGWPFGKVIIEGMRACRLCLYPQLLGSIESHSNIAI